MIEKQTSTQIDHITENGGFSIRTVTRYVEGGKVVAEKVHRRAVSPGDDVETEPETAKAVARAMWTPEMVEAWSDEFKAMQAAKRAEHAEELKQVAGEASQVKEALEVLQSARAMHKAEVEKTRLVVAELRGQHSALKEANEMLAAEVEREKALKQEREVLASAAGPARKGLIGLGVLGL